METHRFRVGKDVARWMKGWNKMRQLTRSWGFRDVQSSTIKEFPVAEDMHNCITQLTEEKTLLSEQLAELILKTSLVDCSKVAVAPKPRKAPKILLRTVSTPCPRAIGNLPLADIEDLPALKGPRPRRPSSSRTGLAPVKVSTDVIDVPIYLPRCEAAFSIVHKQSVILRDSIQLRRPEQGSRTTAVEAARTAVMSACSLALRRSWL